MAYHCETSQLFSDLDNPVLRNFTNKPGISDKSELVIVNNSRHTTDNTFINQLCYNLQNLLFL